MRHCNTTLCDAFLLVVQKELTEIAKDTSSGVTVRIMSEASLHKLQGCLKGAFPCCRLC